MVMRWEARGVARPIGKKASGMEREGEVEAANSLLIRGGGIPG